MSFKRGSTDPANFSKFARNIPASLRACASYAAGSLHESRGRSRSNGSSSSRARWFVVAGITTSDVDEHPFVRAPARPVRLVAKDGRNGVLEIQVDRGVATYPQPLPGEDDRAGWGATEGESVYTSIAALPSATVAVRQGDEELGRARWGDVERDGRADSPARSCSNWRKAAATGCMSASSTTRPGGRCRAGSISVRLREFPTSRTATTFTSRKMEPALRRWR